MPTPTLFFYSVAITIGDLEVTTEVFATSKIAAANQVGAKLGRAIGERGWTIGEISNLNTGAE